MCGLGSVLAFGVGSMLYNLHRTVPFLTAAAVTLASLVILLVFIREKRDTVSYSVRVKQPMPVLKELDRTTVLMLGAIFFWFVAYQGVEAMFTLYGTNHLGMSDSEASFTLLYFSAAFLLTCIPAGFLGTRFGKKVTMTIGVAGLGSVFVAMIFINATIWLQFVLIVGGIFWAFININSYPYIVSVGKDERIGTRTGLYYLVSALSAIISPPLLGRLIDLFGYSVMFLYSAAAMALAFVCICCVKRDKTTVDPGLSADKA
jgi:MFS family permease